MRHYILTAEAVVVVAVPAVVRAAVPAVVVLVAAAPVVALREGAQVEQQAGRHEVAPGGQVLGTFSALELAQHLRDHGGQRRKTARPPPAAAVGWEAAAVW
jgi:hypothetical protein